LLVFSPLLLSKFISRIDSGARWAYVGLLAAFIVGGSALYFYGWRLDRQALRERRAREQTDSDIATPS
jgi:hypothetical protein